MNQSATLDRSVGASLEVPASTTTAETPSSAHAHHADEAPAASTKKAKKIKKSALPRKAAYFVLYVPDMAQAVEFYKGKLNMKLGYQSEGWTEFKAGIKFALHQWSPKSEGSCSASFDADSGANAGSCSTTFKPQKTGLCFGVKDAGKSHEAFKALGVKVHELNQVCEEGRGFDFEDPFGNTLSIYGR